MSSSTDRELPDFTALLHEIPDLIDSLMDISQRHARRRRQREALQAAMVADVLDLARQMINDFRGVSSADHTAPPPSGVSLN